MKHFLKVPLLGQGTKEVESLPSYLCRLSVENSLTPFDRLLTQVSYRFVRGKRAQRYDVGYWLQSNIFNRNVFSFFNAEFGDLVSVSTLESLNFLRISSQTECFNFFTWCPYCMADMKRSAQPYFKLSWSLRGVHFCDIHHSPLQDFCQRCGARQSLIEGLNSLSKGNCFSCGACLSRISTQRPIPKEEQYIDRDILELVECIAKGEGDNFSKQKLMLSLKHLSMVISDLYGDFSPEIEMFNLLESGIKQNYFRFADLRKVGYFFQIPMTSLLKGEAQYMTIPLKLDHHLGPRNNYPFKHREGTSECFYYNKLPMHVMESSQSY